MQVTSNCFLLSVVYLSCVLLTLSVILMSWWDSAYLRARLWWCMAHLALVHGLYPLTPVSDRHPKLLQLIITASDDECPASKWTRNLKLTDGTVVRIEPGRRDRLQLILVIDVWSEHMHCHFCAIGRTDSRIAVCWEDCHPVQFNGCIISYCNNYATFTVFIGCRHKLKTGSPNVEHEFHLSCMCCLLYNQAWAIPSVPCFKQTKDIGCDTSRPNLPCSCLARFMFCICCYMALPTGSRMY